MTASESVGCPWHDRAMSSVDAPYSIATTHSWISSPAPNACACQRNDRVLAQALCQKKGGKATKTCTPRQAHLQDRAQAHELHGMRAMCQCREFDQLGRLLCMRCDHVCFSGVLLRQGVSVILMHTICGAMQLFQPASVLLQIHPVVQAGPVFALSCLLLPDR